MTQAHLHNANGPARFPGLLLFALLSQNFALHFPCVFPPFLLLFSAYLLFSGVVYEPW